MKKIKILIALSVFIFTCVSESIVYAADESENLNLNLEVAAPAIMAPLSLPVWTPPFYAAPVFAREIQHLNILRNIIAPVISGSSFVNKSKQTAKADTDTIPVNNDINDFSNGEILYNIDFINSEETPIYSDTVIFIKIPEELKYSENSLKLNNQKLTDESDKDRLNFLNEDNTLKISLKELNKNKRITINFGAKPLTSNIPEKTPHCLIKFQSKFQKSELNWKPF